MYIDIISQIVYDLQAQQYISSLLAHLPISHFVLILFKVIYPYYITQTDDSGGKIQEK